MLLLFYMCFTALSRVLHLYKADLEAKCDFQSCAPSEDRTHSGKRPYISTLIHKATEPAFTRKAQI